jgi:hypothetical protein
MLLVATAVGCASLGEPYQPVSAVPADKALVYIYRPKSFVGAAISYTVHVGNVPAVKLVNGGYTTFIADPGETEFWAKTEARSSVTEFLKAGNVYYLKGGVGIGLVAGRPKLGFVSAQAGQLEIASCRTIPAEPAQAAVAAKP